MMRHMYSPVGLQAFQQCSAPITSVPLLLLEMRFSVSHA